MPKLNTFNGEDRLNFLLSLVGFLQNRGPVSIAEAAQHFELSVEYVRKAVTSINEARADINGFEEWFFMIDLDALEEEGMLSLTDNLVLDGAPRLSTRQTSAIAAGLNYLASMPEFANDNDVKFLVDLISEGQVRSSGARVEVKPGTVEAGLELLRRAILDGVQISCEYFNQKGERTNRVIEPLRLDPSPDGTYLRGFCPLNQEVRNFRLDRMRSIDLLNEPLTAQALAVGQIDDAIYVAGITDTQVTVEVDPEAYGLIAEFQPLSEPKDVGNSKIRTTISIGHLPNIGRLIARYGGSARVIEPAQARTIVREYAQKAMRENPAPKQIEDEG
ncbi:helix-turn-helix transcriptional regulator [Rhodoluna limnophila]|uniref:helix-turn-helix transcriptional regulator n=1 Tax=Rhodoluna limnophila TaxID=232537 RepID=UPI001105C022|nr:WYL domain-containing protein [Rhodoluna limnophila]